MVDCQLNGIPDVEELAENDCNQNRIPDDCDIAAGTSTDIDADNLPDECAGKLLSGWWRFEFSSTNGLPSAPVCNSYEYFEVEVRYMNFGEEGELLESWAPVVQFNQYLVLTYPDSSGPSYVLFKFTGERTADMSRTALTEVLPTAQAALVRLEETVLAAPQAVYQPETGDTTIEATADPSWSALEGTWRFETPEETLCGRVTAQRFDGPPPPL